MDIIIFDDHGLFRAGMEQLLKTVQPKSRVNSVGALADFDTCCRAQPDTQLVLLDYHIPGLAPHETIAHVRHCLPKTKIVIVSAETDPKKILAAIEAGVSGFIPKAADPELLVAALSLVIAGGVYLPGHVSAYLHNAAPEQEMSVTNPFDALSSRQREALKLAINGNSNQDIAAQLDISIDTVKAHLSKAYRAIGVNSRTQAVLLVNKLEVAL